jgi:hypothetical protein
MVPQTLRNAPLTVATHSKVLSENVAATREKFRLIFLAFIGPLFAYRKCRKVCEVTLVPAVAVQPDRVLHQRAELHVSLNGRDCSFILRGHDITNMRTIGLMNSESLNIDLFLIW